MSTAVADSSSSKTDDGELSDEDVAAAFKLLYYLTHRANASTGTLWEDGTPPNSSPALVIADGLASRSTPFATNPPWIASVRDAFRPRIPCADIRQFSYLEAGLHYDGRQTTMPFDDIGKRLTAYLPEQGAVSAFMAFSLACPIVIARLSQWIRDDPGASLPCLILLQPAFTIKPRVSQAWHAFPQYTVSGGALDSLDPDEAPRFHQELVQALGVIASRAPVHLRF